jgi:hypothetical protein
MAGLIRDLIASDPEAVREVYFRCLELARDAQKRNQWQMSYGDGSTAGNFLVQMLQGADEASLARLPLIIDIVNNEKNVLVEYEGSDRVGVAAVLRRALNDYSEGKRGEKATGVEAVKRLHDDVAKALGDRPGSLFQDAFYSELKQALQKPEDLEAASKWAADAAASVEPWRLAADFEAAIGLIQTEKPNKNPANPEGETENDAQSSRELKPFEAHFTSLVIDAELPIAWRMHLAALLSRVERERLPLSLRKNLLEVFNEAIEAGVPITNEQQRRMLQWMVSSAKEPELQEGLTAWREKWAKRYLRPATTGARQYERFDQLYDSQILTDALLVYLKSGDVDRANVLLRRYDDQLQSSSLVIVRLLRAEQPELAARFLRTHWSDLELNWPSGQNVYYDETIAKQEPAMLDKLVRDEERFFARALLASLPSYSDDEAVRDQRAKAAQEKKGSQAEAEPAPLRPRDARMVALADEFPKLQFKDETFRMRSLVVLSRSAPASNRLRETIAEQYTKANLPLTFQQDDEREWRLQSELAARHFANEFAAGKFEDFVATFDKLAKSIGDNNYDSGRKLGKLITGCFSSLRRDATAWTPEMCGAIGKSLRGLLTDKDYLYLEDFEDFNTLVFITAVRSGQTKDAAAWYKKLSNNCKSWVRNRGVSNRTWGIFAKMVGKPGKKNLAERMKLIESAVTLANDMQWLQFNRQRPHQLAGNNQQPVFQQVVKAKLATRKELLAYAKDVENAKERPFLANITLAEWLVAQKQHKEAAAAYEAGVAKLPKSWRLRRVLWKIAAGKAWANAGELENARRLAGEVEGKTQEPVEKQRLGELTKLIEKKTNGEKAKPEAAEKSEKKDSQARVERAAMLLTVRADIEQWLAV